MPRKAILRGVQGSRGPLVGGRRIETAGPLVLSVMKEQRYVDMLLKKAAKLSRQVSCKATPARANKEKINVCGAARVRDFPQGGRCRNAR